MRPFYLIPPFSVSNYFPLKVALFTEKGLTFILHLMQFFLLSLLCVLLLLFVRVPDAYLHELYFCFQCIKDLCLLLLNQSLLLPALKLLVESRDQDLHAVALGQITAVAKV